ncbi:hypothetical protein [Phaeobacter sp. B1627]|uniref:hypothetical protein n=1 Tax=Phaeobacter sp. B1627 TaxID=2583809 RepID=UPI00111AED1C|nr:hypothetical protein [Phaeobacter sp. B1627]TNJ48068.1 hypothetical protein FGE21_02035 [Phaeobacter sp. B1627]
MLSLARSLSGAALAAGVYLALAAPAQADCTSQLILNPASPLFLTSDTPFLSTQPDVNCYSWQMFISLNWPADPDWPGVPAKAGEPDRSAAMADFGKPGGSGQPMAGATVWESFMPAPGIFKPGAATPDAWGTRPPLPPSCKSTGLRAAGSYPKVLTASSKAAVHPRHGFNLTTGTQASQSDEIMEAVGGWLTDQSGKLVFFERLVGKAEYDYIAGSGLYDAATQMSVATNADGTTPQGLSLPAGARILRPPSTPQPQEELGAFELKAAWRVLTGMTAQYPRYLTASTWLLRPDTGVCTQEVVGLVGLHIIHKTSTFPDFVWATFEQVDNVQEKTGETPPPGGYSFFDPSSSETPNQPRIKCSSSGCTDLFPRDQPVQVTREVPTVQAMDSLNSAVQSLIKSQSGGASVFQYYKLVNVLWDGAPTPPMNEPGANAKVPLHYGSFESQGNQPVANTTMETYAQKVGGGSNADDASCNICHRGATIAGSSTLASDFSFLFGTASSQASVPGVTVSQEFRP